LRAMTENTLLAEENARLAHMNQMMRDSRIAQMQIGAPPGLEQKVPSGSAHAPPATTLARPGRKSHRSSGQGQTTVECDQSRVADVSSGPLKSMSRQSTVSTASTSFTSSSKLSHSRMSSLSANSDASTPGLVDINLVQALDTDHQSLGVESQEPTSSVMMRNLPNDYTRTMLLELLRTEGFAGMFDFVYVPVDFRSCSGLGYAFINFNSFESAERFRQHFTGFEQWSSASDKVCEVAWSALQGLEAHIERYRNSPVMHESVPEDQKPIIFEGLVAVPFPVATKKIRVPRHWHRRR